MNRQMEEQTERLSHTDRLADTQINEQKDRWIVRKTDRQRDRYIYKQIDEQTETWTGSLMERHIYGPA